MSTVANDLYSKINHYCHWHIRHHPLVSLSAEQKNKIHEIFKEIETVPIIELGALSQKIIKNPRIATVIRLSFEGTTHTAHLNFIHHLTMTALDNLSYAILTDISCDRGGIPDQLDRWLEAHHSYFTKEIVDSLSKDSLIHLTAFLGQAPQKIREKYPAIFNLLNQDHLTFFSSPLPLKDLLNTPLPEEERFLCIAAHLSSYQIIIGDQLLSKSEWEQLIPHLRYGNFTHITDEKMIVDFLHKGKKLSYIKINNRTLTEIPELPACQFLDVKNCIKLKTLPSRLDRCRSLYACNTAIPALPEMPVGEWIECNSCTSLKTLPKIFPACFLLSCCYCTALEDFPESMPLCKRLFFEESSRHAPVPGDLPEGCCVRGGFFTILDYSKFVVNVDHLTTLPKQLLNCLGNNFLLKDKPIPVIHYMKDGEQSEVFDAGGVLRDFISRLMRSLFTTDPSDDDRLAINESGWPIYSSGAKLKSSYRTIGRIMAFCFPDDSPLKPGYLFPDHVFRAIAAFSSPETPTDRDWISAYLILKNTPQTLLALFEDDVVLSTITDRDWEYAAALCAEVNGSDVKDFSALKENRVNLKECLLDAAKNESFLVPIQLMAQELKAILKEELWKELQGEPYLMERIQGTLDCPLVLKALSWKQGDNVSAINQQKTETFVIDAIKRATPEQLRTFVYVVTGNNSLSPKIPITIQTSNLGSALPVAHTCDFLLTLSAEYESQAIFDEKMVKFLEHAPSGAGFSSR